MTLQHTVIWLKSLGYEFDARSETELRQQAFDAVLDYAARERAITQSAETESTPLLSTQKKGRQAA